MLRRNSFPRTLQYVAILCSPRAAATDLIRAEHKQDQEDTTMVTLLSMLSAPEQTNDIFAHEQRRLPEAIQKQASSDCGGLSDYCE